MRKLLVSLIVKIRVMLCAIPLKRTVRCIQNSLLRLIVCRGGHEPARAEPEPQARAPILSRGTCTNSRAEPNYKSSPARSNFEKLEQFGAGSSLLEPYEPKYKNRTCGACGACEATLCLWSQLVLNKSKRY